MQRKTRRRKKAAPSSKEVTAKDLLPADYNPRKMSDEARAALKRSMEEFDDISGITWNKKTKRWNIDRKLKMRKGLILEDSPDSVVDRKVGTIVIDYRILNLEMALIHASKLIKKLEHVL